MTSDSSWEVKLNLVRDYFYDELDLKYYFLEKNYGGDIQLVSFVLICDENSHNYKQRIKFDKKSKALYIDIMLDYKIFLKVGLDKKIEIVKEELIKSLEKGLLKFKYKQFDKGLFVKDFTYWITNDIN